MTAEYINRTLELMKRLQDRQLEIIRLENDIDRVPEQIDELERETEESTALVERSEEELREEQKRIRQLELGLEEAQEKLSHFNDQILLVKTNEQLWALQKEIEFFKKKISDLETEVLESMELIDSKTEALEKSRNDSSQFTSENQNKIAEHEQHLAKMKEDLIRVREDQEEIRSEIPGELIDLFERIQQAKGGLAVALARDGICQACNFRIRPQVYMEVRNLKGIHQCDNCQRILYFEEEPPLENPAELS